ncbi:LLM class flavin-dependent oxidoreductase [uncultured Mycobacterium sp.]|uniref:LLM class flavin-dependent oxidoreductase n=1 Tax=uncultured Mycobacterium sp. TaxID=171292 RepID=UPI0035CAD16B
MNTPATPRLKVDGGVSTQLARVPQAVAALERQGYDGCWTAEVSHDPFLPLVLAAEHSSTLELGTSIAVAFARNPMTVANVGWDLQAYSRGRFILGLGSQIQAHIEKRFSMPWSHPVRRMREFILALRAIWSTWRDGTPLRFDGEFYTHATRKQIAFYGSTPAYCKVLELHGWGDLQTELHELSRRGEWDTMGSLIGDDMLNAFAVVAELDELADKIRDRCDGVIDRVVPSLPPQLSETAVRGVLEELRAQRKSVGNNP